MIPLPVLVVKHPPLILALPPLSPLLATFPGNRSKRLSAFHSLSCANFFTIISFTDPHPLNSVVSYRYKNSGGWGSSIAAGIHHHSAAGRSNCFPLNTVCRPPNPYGSIFYKNTRMRGVANRPIFHPLPTFRIRRTIPSARRLPLGKTCFVILELKRELSNRDQTSRLHRSILEHRAARLGLHQ